MKSLILDKQLIIGILYNVVNVYKNTPLQLYEARCLESIRVQAFNIMKVHILV